MKPKEWNWFKRRSAIEPIIGHTKAGHRMDRNYLKGEGGDKINAILAGCGFNLIWLSVVNKGIKIHPLFLRFCCSLCLPGHSQRRVTCLRNRGHDKLPKQPS